jgi:hypothetical protein
MVDKVQTTFKENTETKTQYKNCCQLNICMCTCACTYTHIYTHTYALPSQMHVKKDKYLSRVELKEYKSTVIGSNEDPTTKTHKLFKASFDMRFELFTL